MLAHRFPEFGLTRWYLAEDDLEKKQWASGPLLPPPPHLHLPSERLCIGSGLAGNFCASVTRSCLLPACTSTALAEALWVVTTERAEKGREGSLCARVVFRPHAGKSARVGRAEHPHCTPTLPRLPSKQPPTQKMKSLGTAILTRCLSCWHQGFCDSCLYSNCFPDLHFKSSTKGCWTRLFKKKKTS